MACAHRCGGGLVRGAAPALRRTARRLRGYSPEKPQQRSLIVSASSGDATEPVTDASLYPIVLPDGRRGRLLAPSTAVSSSAFLAQPPPPSCRMMSRISDSPCPAPVVAPRLPDFTNGIVRAAAWSAIGSQAVTPWRMSGMSSWYALHPETAATCSRSAAESAGVMFTVSALDQINQSTRKWLSRGRSGESVNRLVFTIDARQLIASRNSGSLGACRCGIRCEHQLQASQPWRILHRSS